MTVYSDCTGQSALTRPSAVIDTCIPGELGIPGLLYFVGHNYGVFTPLFDHAGTGTVMTYYDGKGVVHSFVIQGYVDVPTVDGAPEPPAGTVAEFQTCADASGTTARIFWATAP